MTLDEALASGRHVISYGAGFMTAFGLTKIVAPDVLITSFDHIFNGVKEIAVGVGPLAGAGMAWWATHRSTPAAQVASVKAIAPAELAVAMTKVAPAEMVVAVKNMPEVAGVVTTDTPDGVALARSIPSASVASAGTADAVAIAKPTGA